MNGTLGALNNNKCLPPPDFNLPLDLSTKSKPPPAMQHHQSSTSSMCSSPGGGHSDSEEGCAINLSRKSSPTPFRPYALDHHQLSHHNTVVPSLMFRAAARDHSPAPASSPNSSDLAAFAGGNRLKSILSQPSPVSNFFGSEFLAAAMNGHTSPARRQWKQVSNTKLENWFLYCLIEIFGA
jgi:hypothetical protein